MTYVGVDFERDDLMARLVEHGFDAASPAEFMWLGVVPYLTREAVAATLRAVASVPDAEVVFDYAAADGQEETPGSKELAARVAQRASRSASGGSRPSWRHCSPSRGSTTSRTSGAPRSARATSASSPDRRAAVGTWSRARRT